MAPLDASGWAEFGGGTIGGPTILSLETQGLNPGMCQVLAVLRGAHTKVSLGWIGLSNVAVTPDLEAGDNRKEPSVAHEARVMEAQSQLKLPRGLAPGQIDQIIVADALGDALLMGTLKPAH